MTEPRLVFLVPRKHVKHVKTVLENQNLLDRTTKITARQENAQSDEKSGQIKQTCMAIATTISLFDFSSLSETDSKRQHDLDQTERFLKGLGLGPLSSEICISKSSSPIPSNTIFSPRNTVIKALYKALSALPETFLPSLELTPASLASSFPESYSVHKPLLLLPSHAFSAPPWNKLIATHSLKWPHLSWVWKQIADSVGATHVAINAGIPLKTPDDIPKPETEAKDRRKDNILRSPVNLTPLYGNFGTLPTSQTISEPTAKDFEEALWVTTTQNGIHQVWAPLYTMFSRGNIREKTRLLSLPSVTSVQEINHHDPTITKENDVGQRSGCTAVDLYAGIGYFAFSYRRASLSPILCWELNPWSIEGLRRGAILNKWTASIFTSFPSTGEEWKEWVKRAPETDFLVFRQSNEAALTAIAQLARGEGERKRIPSIRHVNCGLLPSSRLSWSTAVKAIDPKLGGWVHLHENVGVDDIEEMKSKVEMQLQGILDEWEAEEGGSGSRRRVARCEHVERVKTFAPGVVHVVFDVWVDGEGDC